LGKSSRGKKNKDKYEKEQKSMRGAYRKRPIIPVMPSGGRILLKKQGEAERDLPYPSQNRERGVKKRDQGMDEVGLEGGLLSFMRREKRNSSSRQQGILLSYLWISLR